MLTKFAESHKTVIDPVTGERWIVCETVEKRGEMYTRLRDIDNFNYLYGEDMVRDSNKQGRTQWIFPEELADWMED